MGQCFGGIGVFFFSSGGRHTRFDCDWSSDVCSSDLVYIDTDGYTIVGVMPPGFRHPGKTIAGDVDVCVTAGYKADPFPHPPKRDQRFIPGAMARLKPGITLAQAQSRLN